MTLFKLISKFKRRTHAQLWQTKKHIEDVLYQIGFLVSIEEVTWFQKSVSL